MRSLRDKPRKIFRVDDDGKILQIFNRREEAMKQYGLSDCTIWSRAKHNTKMEDGSRLWYEADYDRVYRDYDVEAENEQEATELIETFVNRINGWYENYKSGEGVNRNLIWAMLKYFEVLQKEVDDALGERIGYTMAALGKSEEFKSHYIATHIINGISRVLEERADADECE